MYYCMIRYLHVYNSFSCVANFKDTPKQLMTVLPFSEHRSSIHFQKIVIFNDNDSGILHYEEYCQQSVKNLADFHCCFLIDLLKLRWMNHTVEIINIDN